AVGGPTERFLTAGPARNHIDPIGDHEGRVESDPELPDERRRFAVLLLLEPVYKRLGARTRYRPERLDHFIAAHADAIVFNGDLTIVGINLERDPRGRIIAEQGWIGDRLITQPFTGVGRVGDQFTQEHLLLGINRVHHHVQEFRDVGLEGAAVALRFVDYGH